MKTNILYSVARGLLCISLALSSLHCTTKIAGSEVTNEKATVYGPDNSPTAGATVHIVPVNYIPGTTAGSTGGSTLYNTTTDQNGQYQIPRLDDGMYNILIQKDSLGSIQDSVTIGATGSVTNDTLQPMGSLMARVEVQANHNPQTVTIQVLGTYYYTNVDSAGRFIIANLAAGTYTLRVITTLAEYTPTYKSISVRAGKTDTLPTPIRLIYTGIPVVTGLLASYNQMNGIVSLTWNPAAGYSDLLDYIVYRDPAAAIDPSSLPFASVPNNTFYDTLFRGTSIDSTSLQYRYRVCVRNNSLIKGVAYRNVVVMAVSPKKSGSLFLDDSIGAPANMACTLKVSPGTRFGRIVSYAWDIGNTGTFKNSAKAETTFVLASGLNPDFQCVAKVTDSSGSVGLDTIHIQSWLAWEKIAPALGTNLSNFSALEFNGKLWVFASTFTYYSGYTKYSLWNSIDGITWQKQIDTLPCKVPSGKIRPIVFNNKIWILNRDTVLHFTINSSGDSGLVDSSKIWQSGNGTLWSAAPCTLLTHNSASDFWLVSDNKLWLNHYDPYYYSSINCWNSLDGNAWNPVAGAGFANNIEYVRNVSSCTRNDTVVLAINDNPSSISLFDKAFKIISSPNNFNFPIEKIINFNNTFIICNADTQGVGNSAASASIYSTDLTQWHSIGPSFPVTERRHHDEIVFKNRIFSISNNGIWASK